MAKGKKPSKRPQAQHKPKSRSSQHDKRKRLDTPNPRRKKIVKAKVPLTGKMAVLVASMTGMLDARMAFRLSIIMAGMLLADDRRVAAAWFAAAGVQDDWDRFYDCLISVGRKTQLLALPLLEEKYAWKFRTKLELAVDLVTWFLKSVRSLGVECKIWLVTDGAYAGRPVLKPLTDLGVVIFSRLRKDACLFDLPPAPKPGKRGTNRIYGFHRISLAKLVSAADGWESMTYHCRGSMVTRGYKTFLATSKLVSGVVRVVIVRFDDGGWWSYAPGTSQNHS